MVLAAGNFNMPILYTLEYRYNWPWQLFTNKLYWIQFVLFFLWCERSQASKMELCAKMFYRLEVFNCLFSYLARTKLHLRCLIGFSSMCASESCFLWNYEDTSHSQRQPNSRFLAVFKACVRYFLLNLCFSTKW